MKDIIDEELIDLLCGRELGSGAYRTVFNCKLNEKWVIKVANADGRQANIMEAAIWSEMSECNDLKKWFAPVIAISDAGKYLIMEKCEIGRQKDYPIELPCFLTDTKKTNYGWLNDKFVCFDYASSILVSNWKGKKRKVTWYEI